MRKSLSERTATATELLGQLGVHDEAQRTSAPKVRVKEKAMPIAEKLRRTSRRALVFLLVTLIAYMVLNGIVSGVLLVAGLWLFYHAQAHVRRKGRRAALTVAAFVILSPRLLASFIPQVGYVMTLGTAGDEDNNNVRTAFEAAAERLGVPLSIVLSVVVLIVLILSLLLPVLGGTAFANFRRARREEALLETALAGQTGSDKFLSQMRDMLSNRFEDVGFHLRPMRNCCTLAATIAARRWKLG